MHPHASAASAPVRSLVAAAILAGAMLVGVTGSIAAQAPAGRAALDALRDTLDRAATAEAVAEVSRDWSDGRGGVMLRLRRGLIALRVGEIRQSRAPLDEALVEFGEAAIRERQWPYPRYGLARTKLALNAGDWPPKPDLYHAAGESWYKGFTDAIAEALEREPWMPAAESLLLGVLADQGQREQPQRLVRLLERSAASDSADPRVHLILGRSYRATGDGTRSLAAFERYAAVAAAAEAELELARALEALGRSDDAVAAYWAGLANPDDATRAEYRRDLAWIADSAEMRAFDSLSSAEVRPWLRDFWADRDAVELREPGARLREHLRRWNYVHAHFRIPDPDRRTQFERRPIVKLGPCIDGQPAGINDLEFDDHTWRDDGRRRERLLDDRAIVYMRHGEPARRITVAGATTEIDALIATGAAPAELRTMVAAHTDTRPSVPDWLGEDDGLEGRSQAWLYWFAGEPRVFHFTGGDAAGRHEASTLTITPPRDEHYLRALAEGTGDRRYARLAFLLQNRAAGWRLARDYSCYDSHQDLRRDRRADMLAAVNTDSYTRLFPVDLTPLVQAFALGEPERGTGRALVVFAVPGQRLTPQPRADGNTGVAYRLTISAVAYDSTLDVVRRVDTTRTFVAADTLGEGEYLSGHLELPIPAGRYEVRAAVVQDSLIGGAGYQAGVELGRGSGGLALSDIVLGRAGSGLTWRRNGEEVPLNPLGAFEKGGSAELYYELTGTKPGTTYTTTIEVRRGQRGEKRTGTALRFTETARGSAMRVSRSLGLRNLGDGVYRLRVKIEEEGSGRAVTREQTLRVAED